LQIAHLASEEQAIGRSIDRWLGRSGVDLNVLLNNLRQHESVKLFATKLRSEYGTPTDVEISVGTYSDGDDEGFAFFVRDVGRRIASEPSMSTRLPKSVEQITQQVGRVPLKDLVRQSTDLVEQLCIERALELTGDNKASAAELLGVSRQGLYVKLNRYNLADGGAED
jgi:transcriptional regulator PpsR